MNNDNDNENDNENDGLDDLDDDLDDGLDACDPPWGASRPPYSYPYGPHASLRQEPSITKDLLEALLLAHQRELDNLKAYNEQTLQLYQIAARLSSQKGD